MYDLEKAQGLKIFEVEKNLIFYIQFILIL